MATDKRRGWPMQTYTGVKFWPFDPRPEEVRIRDIAQQLSLTCRFGSACREFYSVAEHSLFVARMMPKEDALFGLMHDAAEAYLGDVPHPQKPHVAFCSRPYWARGSMSESFEGVEVRLMSCIARALDLPWPPSEDAEARLKEVDVRVGVTERRDLMTAVDWPWAEKYENAEPYEINIVPLLPSEARWRFVQSYEAAKGQTA